jgi:hypothetical protein
LDKAKKRLAAELGIELIWLPPHSTVRPASGARRRDVVPCVGDAMKTMAGVRVSPTQTVLQAPTIGAHAQLVSWVGLSIVGKRVPEKEIAGCL